MTNEPHVTGENSESSETRVISLVNLNLRLKKLNEFNETSEFNDECPNETSHPRAMLLPPIVLLWHRVKTSGKAL